MKKHIDWKTRLIEDAQLNISDQPSIAVSDIESLLSKPFMPQENIVPKKERKQHFQAFGAAMAGIAAIAVLAITMAGIVPGFYGLDTTNSSDTSMSGALIDDENTENNSATEATIVSSATEPTNVPSVNKSPNGGNPVDIAVTFDSEEVQGEIYEVCRLKDGSMVSVGSTRPQFDSMWHSEGMESYAGLRTEGDVGYTAIAAKYNADGTIAFLKTFGGSGEERFTDVIATSDGGFIAAGQALSISGGDFDRFNLQTNAGGCAFMVKYDRNGNEVWAISGYKEQIHEVTDMVKNKNGEICVVGYHVGDNGGPSTYFSLRLNSNGEFLNEPHWQRMVDSTVLGYNAFLYAEDGSLYFCGSKGYHDNGRYDVYFGKYDADGKLEFEKTLAANGFEDYRQLIFTPDGNIMVWGYFYDSTSGELFDMIGVGKAELNKGTGSIIVKYSPDGEVIGGDIITLEQKDLGFGGISRLISLDDGSVLFHYAMEAPFKDPVSGVIMQIEENQTYFYGVDENGKFEHLYSIGSYILGIHRGRSYLEKMDDGTVQIIGIKYNDSPRTSIRIFDVSDKAHALR